MRACDSRRPGLPEPLQRGVPIRGRRAHVVLLGLGAPALVDEGVPIEATNANGRKARPNAMPPEKRKEERKHPGFLGA